MLFTPHLVYLNKSSELESLNKAIFKFQDVRIIPRSECSFRRVSLNGRGRKSIKAALLKAQNDTGKPNMKFIVIPEASGSFGGEWGYVQAASDTKRSLPESLAREGLSSGARLVSSLSGCEGQIWDAGSLVASRWWKTKPTTEQWRDFCRTSEVASPYISMSLTAAEQIPFRSDLPFISFDRARLEEIFKPLNLAFAVGILFASAMFYLTGQYGRQKINLKQTEAKIEAAEGTAGKILSQRRRALSNLKYVQKKQNIGIDNLLLVALDDIGNAFRDTDYVIARATLSSNELNLILQGDDDVSIPQMVAKLEAMPSLSKVTISLNNNKALRVNSQLVVPRQEDIKG